MSQASPIDEDAWVAARSAEVAACVHRVALEHGRIGEWPAWHVMPYASIWAVENRHRPEWIGWWVIAGDLPTDTIAAQGLDTPRDAMRAFGKRWVQHADSLDRGELPQAWSHLPDAAMPKLAAQLRSRGTALQAWADDDSVWPADDGHADAED